jgi:hypothetical protein
VLDQVSYPALGIDLSWGRWPNAVGDWRLLSAATPGAANQHEDIPEDLALFVNEFMASNSTTIADEMGQYEDWVEIYNGGTSPVNLGGLFLTDDLAQSTQWQFPEVELAAGGFLLVWCDDDLGDGPLHANFKLSAGGETIALFGRATAGNPLIDGYEFGPQSPDISEGRYYDGALPWHFFDLPTPGASNRDAIAAPPPAGATLRLLANHPNPFNPATRLAFETPRAGHVRLEIVDVRGRRLRLLLDGELPAGRHALDWDGRDDAGRALPSGLYLSRLGLDGEGDSGRLLLLR